MTRLESPQQPHAPASLAQPILAALILGLLAATVIGQLGRQYWAFDLFAHFKAQYAVAFGIAATASVLWRRHLLALVALCGCLFNGWPVLAFAYMHHEPPAGARGNFRLVSFNAGLWNEHYAEIGAFLESTQADAVVLLEYDNDHLDRLAPHLPSYPYRSSEPADLLYGAAIVSRWPIARSRSLELSSGGAAAARATIAAGPLEIDVFGIHLSWPAAPASVRRRNAELANLSTVLAGCKRACVVAGDFNVTQWSPHFQDFQARSGWKNCAEGQRLVRTWPNMIWPLGIQIDQCLTTPETRVRRFAVGPSLGSDHFPIVIDLAFDSR